MLTRKQSRKRAEDDPKDVARAYCKASLDPPWLCVKFIDDYIGR